MAQNKSSLGIVLIVGTICIGLSFAASNCKATYLKYCDGYITKLEYEQQCIKPSEVPSEQ